MSPKMTTGAAAGVAVQIVVVLMWLLAMEHITVPNDVAIALAGIITWVGGLLLHPSNPAAGDASPPSNRMTPIVRSIIGCLMVAGLTAPLAFHALATGDPPAIAASSKTAESYSGPTWRFGQSAGQLSIECRRPNGIWTPCR
jgi:hypothetical protein